MLFLEVVVAEVVMMVSDSMGLNWPNRCWRRRRWWARSILEIIASCSSSLVVQERQSRTLLYRCAKRDFTAAQDRSRDMAESFFSALNLQCNSWIAIQKCLDPYCWVLCLCPTAALSGPRGQGFSSPWLLPMFGGVGGEDFCWALPGVQECVAQGGSKLLQGQRQLLGA